MDLQSNEENREQHPTKSFTQALKEKYCMPEEQRFSSICVIGSPKRKNATAELGHLRTIVLNSTNVMTADIPHQGLMWLCPNVVDLDLTNNLLDKWSELLAILHHLPQLKFVNVSGNNLSVDKEYENVQKASLNVENLALNETRLSIEDIVLISQTMPFLKELHLCANDYENLGLIDERIKNGAFPLLECLRLNNNKIKNWREVWKLRHLQCLKILVLSDNPVSGLFYKPWEENTRESDCNKDSFTPQCDKSSEGYQANGSGRGTMLDNLDIPGIRNYEMTDVKNCNPYDNLILMDNHINSCLVRDDKEESASPSEEMEELDQRGGDVARPVSRIGRHEDSDAEDEENQCYAEEKDTMYDMPEDEQDICHACHWLDTSKESNDSSLLTVTDDDSFMEMHAGTDSSDTDMLKYCQENIDDSHFSLIAESFLCGVIDNIESMSASTLSDVLSENSPKVIAKDVPPGKNTAIPMSTKDSNKDADHSEYSSNDNIVVEVEVSRIPFQKNESSNDFCNCNVTSSPKNKTSNTIETSQNVFKTNKLCERELRNCVSTKSEDGMLIYERSQRIIIDADVKIVEEIITSCQNCGKDDIKSTCDTTGQPYHEASVVDLSTVDNNKLNSEDDNTSQIKRNDILDNGSNLIPFENLETLCLSNTGLSHWKNLDIFSLFPNLTNLRMQCNPLYSSVNPEDRRKLYIASLPNVNILNGSQVTATEREKAERFYLRHFMHEEEKPDIFHTLAQKHGEPVELVDIDLSAGYQEWALLDFYLDGDKKFSKKVHLTEHVRKLRSLISQTLGIPKNSFAMHFKPCNSIHPVFERDMTELRCESLPMSRYDFADTDEIHIETTGPSVRFY